MPKRSSVPSDGGGGKRQKRCPLNNIEELFTNGLEWVSEQQALVAPIYNEAVVITRYKDAAINVPLMVLLLDKFKAIFPQHTNYIKKLKSNERSVVQEGIRLIGSEQTQCLRFIDDSHRIYQQYQQFGSSGGESNEQRELRYELLRLLQKMEAPFVDFTDESVMAMITPNEPVPESRQVIVAPSLLPNGKRAKAVTQGPLCRHCKKPLMVFYRVELSHSRSTTAQRFCAHTSTSMFDCDWSNWWHHVTTERAANTHPTQAFHTPCREKTNN